MSRATPEQSAWKLIQTLRVKASERPAELKTGWFDEDLFRCRSQFVKDYLDEAEKNVQRLIEQEASGEAERWLQERVEHQLNALVQALYVAER